MTTDAKKRVTIYRAERTPAKVRVIDMDEEMAWTDDQLRWLAKNKGKVVSGQMEGDEFRPEGAPLVLHAKEYEVIHADYESARCTANPAN